MTWKTRSSEDRVLPYKRLPQCCYYSFAFPGPRELEHRVC